MAEKKKLDYSATAENLCNPGEVMDLLVKLHYEERQHELLNEQLRTANRTLYDQIDEKDKAIGKLRLQIREAIDQFGSYQDVESGEYAVKYRRTSKVYDAEKFAEFFPKYVPAVLSTVNVDELKKLIKGGSISEEELKNCGVTQEEIKYAYYIR